MRIWRSYDNNNGKRKDYNDCFKNKGDSENKRTSNDDDKCCYDDDNDDQRNDDKDGFKNTDANEDKRK